MACDINIVGIGTTSKTGVEGYTQSFVYTHNGSMKNNSRTGSCRYPSAAPAMRRSR